MSSSEADRDGVQGIPSHKGVWYHFAGIGGSGMSALAQFHALAGGRVTGSDRAFDRRERQAIRERLARLGVSLHPQDGTGVAKDCNAVIVSTAVEDDVPDVRAARERGVPIWHRSELLARYVAQYRTLAVTGTSGKSTVAGMIFTILRGAGRDPSLLTGGSLPALEREGWLGNAWAGRGDLLVVEADESDGSLVRYEPWAGILLNLRRDHKEPQEIAKMFEVFRSRTRGPFLAGEDENLDPFAPGAIRFGLGPGCDVRAEDVELTPTGSSFTVDNLRFEQNWPGRHNVQNAIAAIAAARAVDIPLSEMVTPLRQYEGISRRFQVVGKVGGIEVIDDFAHNPDKIGATLRTARLRAERILAVYQPHGFGPTRFLKDGLVAAFAEHLTPEDRLWMPEIYYAGGTVSRDISSRDLIEGIKKRGIPAFFAGSRAEIAPALATEARAGDLILVMGARDPSLTDFCREIVARLERDHCRS